MIFSIIGVLLGMYIFDMDFSVIMMGVGIVALAGIVVRNGILLVEFTDILRDRGMEVKQAIIEAGRIRMTPVLLTATAAILGLIPLAVGFNIDFESLFAHGDPKIFFGGDSVAFWGHRLTLAQHRTDFTHTFARFVYVEIEFLKVEEFGDVHGLLLVVRYRR